MVVPTLTNTEQQRTWRRRNLCVSEKDWAYLKRRRDDRRLGGEMSASCSGEIARVVREARAVRHDVRGYAGTLKLIAQLLRRGASSVEEATQMMEETADEMVKLSEDAADRPLVHEVG